MKLTRALAGASILALAATLAACSSDSGGEATADCPDGVTTLTLLRAENNPPKDEFIAQWEKANSCYKIAVDEVPFDQLATKTQLIGSEDGGPDILEVDGPNTQTFAAAGLLLPIDDYLPDGYADEAVAASVAELSYDGKTYSTGMAQTTLGLYYNKTMLDGLGIIPPTTLDDAWTWDEALKVMQQCQVGDAENPDVFGLAPSAFGNGTAGNAYRDMVILRSAGDPTAAKGSSAYNTYWAIAPEGDTVDGYLNTPEAISAAKVYQSMYQGSTKVTSNEGLPNAFADGKACFDLQTSYLAGNLAATPPDFEWGITPVPYITTPIVHTGDVVLAVSSKTEHPEAAAKFAIDLGIGEEGLAWVASNKSFPSITTTDSQFDYLKDPPLSILNDELVEWGQPRPPSTHFVEYDQLVSEGLRDIAFGADPASALNDTVSKVDDALAR
ncbi:extracellular solute-binding protein [Naasia lichenicola]|uniref:extracellular solute-binding protein n=1 Tax=Naasia lichenicola TaxID=2565933 RepID=UPI00130E95CF|nr:extracellular solute-binding protein [Naasia lichenicola]